MKTNNIPGWTNTAHEIWPHIYVGGYQIATNVTWLADNKITHVLSLGGWGHDISGTIRKVIYINDTENDNISKHFDKCFTFIENAIQTGRILIHCHIGKSRSATIAHYYLMRKFGMPLYLSLVFIRYHRNINPNSGFIRQLQVAEVQLSKHDMMDLA